MDILSSVPEGVAASDRHKPRQWHRTVRQCIMNVLGVQHLFYTQCAVKESQLWLLINKLGGHQLLVRAGICWVLMICLPIKKNCLLYLTLCHKTTSFIIVIFREKRIPATNNYWLSLCSLYKIEPPRSFETVRSCAIYIVSGQISQQKTVTPR